ncbi:hypothetical protein [Roseiconus nitratireducens]|uniref:hypothetical protein n=1 Tax=Roseiconus nitratireducens TaxID=2605748 RepID=UPI00191C3C18|nr:hypothetical protein [Roseiconus nitratireducens]
MATIPTKRSKTLIDTEVQGNLLRKVAAHWVVFFLCNTIALTAWTRLFTDPSASWGETLVTTFREFLPFFVVTASLIPAFAWDTLKLSHRFVGPILRLRRTLKDLKSGRSVPPLKFRDSDFWQELASDFNDVMRLKDAEIAEATSRSEEAESHASV